MVTRRAKPKTKQTPRRTASTPKRDAYLWEKLVAIADAIPEEELAKAPRDGARNLHHYLHGAQKHD